MLVRLFFGESAMCFCLPGEGRGPLRAETVDVLFHAVLAETKQVENQIVEQSFFKVGSNSELAESPQH